MKKIILTVLMLFTLQAHAGRVWVEIDDASKLLWQISADGSMWFRNLDEFDPNQGGCCYAYRLDLNSPVGRAFFSVILAKIEGHQRITLGFPDIGSNSNIQTMDYLGRHGHGTNE